MAYPRFQLARSFKFLQYTAGDIAMNSTSWANLIGTTNDLVLAAQVDDVVEVGLSSQSQNEGSTGRIDVASIVSAAPVNYWGGGAEPSTGYGVSSWTLVSAQFGNQGGSVMKKIVAGDLSAGTVTLRLRYRTDISSLKTLYAAATRPLQFWAKNLGPVDPS